MGQHGARREADATVRVGAVLGRGATAVSAIGPVLLGSAAAREDEEAHHDERPSCDTRDLLRHRLIVEWGDAPRNARGCWSLLDLRWMRRAEHRLKRFGHHASQLHLVRTAHEETVMHHEHRDAGIDARGHDERGDVRVEPL